MENKYCLSDFSSLSVIYTVDKFIKSVEIMNETVMVPSRLLNVEPPDDVSTVPLLLRGNSDPYTFYTVLNNVKNNLIWGPTDLGDDGQKERVPTDISPWLVSYLNGKAAQSEATAAGKDLSKGHFRRISSVSTGSVVSNVSEQECERLSDAGDSGVDSETECISDITSTLKTHVVGLHNCLSQLIETADYITVRYQEEVSV